MWKGFRQIASDTKCVADTNQGFPTLQIYLWLRLFSMNGFFCHFYVGEGDSIGIRYIPQLTGLGKKHRKGRMLEIKYNSYFALNDQLLAHLHSSGDKILSFFNICIATR